MIREEDPRFRHLGRKVALFAAVALAAVACVVVLIGRENDLFSQKYDLLLTVDKGTGFVRGMPVKLSGFRIGRATSISLNDDAKVDIVLSIDRKYQKWIRGDSRARLFKEGLVVGDACIEVSVGTAKFPALEHKEHLAYLKTKSLEEFADDLAENVKPVLTEVKDIIGYLNDPNGDIKQSVKNLKVLSGNLESTRLRADGLIVKTGREMDAVSGKVNGMVDGSSLRLFKVLDDTSAAVRKADGTLTRVDEKLPALLENADKSLKNLEAVSGELKQAGHEVLPRTPALVKKSEQTLDGATSVLEAVQGIWPINNRIEKPKELQFVPGDSNE